MPFLDSDTCAEGGLFISARVFFLVWCHPWMDGWMEKASRPWHPLLYVILLVCFLLAHCDQISVRVYRDLGVFLKPPYGRGLGLFISWIH
jgi:hypothetical protein